MGRDRRDVAEPREGLRGVARKASRPLVAVELQPPEQHRSRAVDVAVTVEVRRGEVDAQANRLTPEELVEVTCHSTCAVVDLDPQPGL
jgi:hypothetical protein